MYFNKITKYLIFKDIINTLFFIESTVSSIFVMGIIMFQTFKTPFMKQFKNDNSLTFINNSRFKFSVKL